MYCILYQCLVIVCQALTECKFTHYNRHTQIGCAKVCKRPCPMLAQAVHGICRSTGLCRNEVNWSLGLRPKLSGVNRRMYCCRFPNHCPPTPCDRPAVQLRLTPFNYILTPPILLLYRQGDGSAKIQLRAPRVKPYADTEENTSTEAGHKTARAEITAYFYCQSGYPHY